ncbi:hypothetical protein EWM64_g6169, partial [Hericium alpestre]
QTLQTSIAVAMKARQAVRFSRLELDAAKQTLKNASPQKQEHARLEVENAEDDLVQKTEVAITLMKAVLDSPEPIKNLNELIKAQLVYHAAAAESLSAVQGEIEELSVAAEGEYSSLLNVLGFWALTHGQVPFAVMTSVAKGFWPCVASQPPKKFSISMITLYLPGNATGIALNGLEGFKAAVVSADLAQKSM